MKLNKRRLYFKIINEIYDNLPTEFIETYPIKKDEFYNFLKAVSGQVKLAVPKYNYYEFTSWTDLQEDEGKQMAREHFRSLADILEIQFKINPKDFFRYFLDEYSLFFDYIKATKK
jgi:hypothetical protein